MHLSHFINQKPYEKIVHKVRRDFVTFIPTILLFIILLIAPLGFRWFIITAYPTFLENATVVTVATICTSIYYLCVVLFFYTEFIGFYLDLLIITNDRILHINQISLFSRSIAEMDLFQTQDVISEIHGFFPSLFKYGKLIIQNASATTKFQSYDVPNPHKLRELILELATQDRKFHAQEENSPRFSTPIPPLKKI
jgi:hypothetical protein